MFDAVHGYGWRLVSFGPDSVGLKLSSASAELFLGILGGKCVHITPEQDQDGQYMGWFENQLGADHVVLIRPDFYVFGHAPSQEIDGLVEDLRDKLGLL